VAFVIIANLGKGLFPKDGIGIEIEFELQEVVGGVFQEKRKVLDRFTSEPALGLTKKWQLILLCQISPFNPFFFRLAHQSKVPRVNTALGNPQVLGDLSYDLMPVKI
jgi:hypothetical protein